MDLIMHMPSGIITIFLIIIIMYGDYTLPLPTTTAPPTTTPSDNETEVDTGICQRTFPCFNMGKCVPKKDARGQDYDYSCECYEDYFDVAVNRSDTKLCTALKEVCTAETCGAENSDRCRNDWGSFWCWCRRNSTHSYIGTNCNTSSGGWRPETLYSIYDPDAIAGHSSFLYFAIVPDNDALTNIGSEGFAGFQTGEGIVFNTNIDYQKSNESKHIGYYLKYLKSRACRTFLHRKRLLRARSTVHFHMLMGYTYHLKDKDLNVRFYVTYKTWDQTVPSYATDKNTHVHVYSDPEECTPTVEIIGCSPAAAGFNIDSEDPFLWDYLDGHTFRPYIVQVCLKENASLRLAWISHSVNVNKYKNFHQQLTYKGSNRESNMMVTFDEWNLSPGFTVPPYYNYSVIELLVYETVDESRVKKKISFYNSVQCQLNDHEKNPIMNVWGGSERNHGIDEDLIINISNTFLPWNKYPYYWEGNPYFHYSIGIRVCLEIPKNETKEKLLNRYCPEGNLTYDFVDRTIPGAVLESEYMKDHELLRDTPIVITVQILYSRWVQKTRKDSPTEYNKFDGYRFSVYPKPSIKYHLVEGSLPAINIRCIRNCGMGGPWKTDGLKKYDKWTGKPYFGASNDIMIDRTRVSVFVVECYERCEPEYDLFDAYKWEVFTSNDNGENVGSYNIEWGKNLSPQECKFLILKENTLKFGHYYIKATLTSFETDPKPWTRYLTHLSGGVRAGSCELKPENGTSGITEFTISCKGFLGGFKHSNLYYEFYQIQKKKSVEETTFLEWNIHSEVGHIVLAKGNETSSSVKVNVTDNFGNIASVDVNVNLTAMTDENTTSLTFNRSNAMSVVNRALAGDNSGTVRIASALVDAIKDLDEPKEDKVKYIVQIIGALSRNEIGGIEGVRQIRMLLNKISNVAFSTLNVESATLLMMTIRNAANELYVYSKTYWSNTEYVVDEITLLVRQVSYATHLLLESIEETKGEDVHDYSEYVDLKRIEELWKFRKFSGIAISVLRTLAASYLNRRVETEEHDFKKTMYHTMLWVHNGSWFEDKEFGDNRANFLIEDDLGEDTIYGLVVFRLPVDILWWRSEFQNMLVNSHILFTYMEKKVYTRSYGDEVRSSIIDTVITYNFNLTINETKIKEIEGSFQPYATDDPFENKVQIYRFLMNKGQELSLNFTKIGVSSIKVVVTVNKEPTSDDFSSALVVGKSDGSTSGNEKSAGYKNTRRKSFFRKKRRKKRVKRKQQIKPRNYDETKTGEAQSINNNNTRKMKDSKVYRHSRDEGKIRDQNTQEYVDNENNDEHGVESKVVSYPKYIDDTGDDMDIYPESSDLETTEEKETINIDETKNIYVEEDEAEDEIELSTYKKEQIKDIFKEKYEAEYENKLSDGGESYHSAETGNIAWQFKGFRVDYKWNESNQDYIEHEVDSNKTLNKTTTIDYTDMPIIENDDSWVYVALMPEDNKLEEATTFSFQAIGSSCQLWENEKWNTSACEITEKTPDGQISCYCDRLGIVSAGTYSIPGTLYVSEKTLASSETPSEYFEAYIAICLIWFIFILMLIWAIFKDKEESKMRNIIVLSDNDLEERYGYLLTVYTGSYKDSGTTSKIGIQLIGKINDSERHILRSDTKHVLQDGSTDWFLIYTDKCLGDLVKMHLWSNSEGHRQAWFCNHIVVRDLQEQKAWVFMIQRWLSLARGDGLINFHLRPTPLKDIYSSNRRLFTNVVHFGGEGHMWLNVFTAHPRSFYTNWERVLVCAFTTLMGVLLTIVFFYLLVSSDSGTRIHTLKFIHLAVALIANIFSWPANSCISFIFRKSSPISLRLKKFKVPAVEDKISLDNYHYFDAEKAKRINRFRKIFFYMLPTNPLCESDMPFKVRVKNLGKPKETCKKHKRKKRKKGELHYHSNYFFLPRIFRIIGWSICIIGILGFSGLSIYLSLFLVPVVNSYIWFITVLLMICMSVVVVEPVRVFITAIIATYVVKTEPMDTDMERGYPLYPKNEHSQQREILTLVRCLQVYRPITAMYIPELREREKIRMKWQEVCTEVIVCFFFVIVVFASLYATLEEKRNLFYHSEHIKDMFDRAVFAGDGLKPIRDTDGVLKYLNDTFVPVFELSDTKEKSKSAGFLADRTLRFVGVPRVRQLRVKKGYDCENTDVAQMLYCTPSYSSDTQDTKSYYMNWKTRPPEGDLYSDRAKEWFWRYRNHSETKTTPYHGEIALYGGGGYVTELGRVPTNMKITVDFMKANNWLDTYTRFINVELTLYCGNTGYLSVVNIAFENDATRYFTTNVSIHTINLHKGPVVPTVVMETIFCLVIALYVFHQFLCVQIYSFKKYFQDIWSIYDILLVFLAVACVGFYLIRRIIFLHMRFVLDRTSDNQFLAIFDASLTDEVFNHCAALLILFTTIRIAKPLCYIPVFYSTKMTMVLEALALVFVTLLMICLMIIFATFGHLATSNQLYPFRSPLSGCMTIIAVLYLNVENVFHKQHWSIQAIYCVMGIVSCIFAVNMYKAILLEGYMKSKIKRMVPKVDYSLIQYIKDEYKYLRTFRTRSKKMKTKRLRGGADIGDQLNSAEEKGSEENDDSSEGGSETETQLKEMNEKVHYATVVNMQESEEEKLEYSLKERKLEIDKREKDTEILHCFLKKRIMKDEESRVVDMNVVNTRLKFFKEGIIRATHVIKQITEDTIKIRNKQDGNETV